MYDRKVAYFDSQIDTPWANAEYGPEETAKLERLFSDIEFSAGISILEPGCGTGRLTEILAERVGPDGRVVALDISPRMVEMAGHRVSGRDNVEVHLAAIEEFPFEESEFDMIMCHQVFPHFEDKEKALNLLARALKPGGKLIVYHFITFAQINDRHRKAGTAVENDMMPTSAEMRRLFEATGLKIDYLEDGDQGYFLSARRIESSENLTVVDG